METGDRNWVAYLHPDGEQEVWSVPSHGDDEYYSGLYVPNGQHPSFTAFEATRDGAILRAYYESEILAHKAHWSCQEAMDLS